MAAGWQHRGKISLWHEMKAERSHRALLLDAANRWQANTGAFVSCASAPVKTFVAPRGRGKTSLTACASRLIVKEFQRCSQPTDSWADRLSFPSKQS